MHFSKTKLTCLLLVSLLFIAGCGKKEKAKLEDSLDLSLINEEASIDKLPQVSNPEELTAQLLDRDFKIQEKFDSEEKVMYQIIESNNLSNCNSLELEFLRNNCLNTILVNQAVSQSDANLCSRIEDEFVKQSCLSIVSN